MLRQGGDQHRIDYFRQRGEVIFRALLKRNRRSINLLCYAIFLSASGRLQEAIEHIRESIDNEQQTDDRFVDVFNQIWFDCLMQQQITAIKEWPPGDSTEVPLAVYTRKILA